MSTAKGITSSAIRELLKITLTILLLSCAFAWAGATPNPADYAVNIHVSSSRIAAHGQQKLNVVIDGKNYQLESYGAFNSLLALGDYKAKLVKDEHKATHDSLRVYEFLFPGQKTRKFNVVGQTE
jgi:hypothetical protein